LAFMFREKSNIDLTISEVRDDVVKGSFLWSLFFMAMCYFMPRIFARAFPKFYDSLSEKKKNEIPTYVSCLFHHCLVVPYGLWLIYADYCRTPEEYLNYNYALNETQVLGYTFGYIFSDFIFFVIGEVMNGKFEYFIHHTLAFALMYTITICPGNANRFIPHFLLCELSSIFFMFAWGFRLVGLGEHFVTKAMEMSFAFSFFLTRVVNLPVATWRVLDFAGDKLNIARLFLWPVLALQFFWFYKIIQSVTKKSKGKSVVEKVSKAE